MRPCPRVWRVAFLCGLCSAVRGRTHGTQEPLELAEADDDVDFPWLVQPPSCRGESAPVPPPAPTMGTYSLAHVCAQACTYADARMHTPVYTHVMSTDCAGGEKQVLLEAPFFLPPTGFLGFSTASECRDRVVRT